MSSGPGATFSWQAAKVGNTAAIRSSDSIRWMAGGFFLPPRIRSTVSEVFRFHRLPDHGLDGLGGQELRHPLQREAVLRPQGQQDVVIAGRGLQLEVERDTE